MYKRRGFTLIELLVVIGILVLLMGILIPVLGRVKRNAKIAATTGLISNIDIALSGYYNDFGVYPDSSPANNYGGALIGGANRLAEGITGYLQTDGAGGAGQEFGFRMNNGNGKIYGPYMNVTATNFLNGAFVDSWMNQIYYYRANKNTLAIFDTVVGGTGIFHQEDNFGNPLTAGNEAFRQMVGDTDLGNQALGNKTIVGRDSYLLVSAGPDGIYFSSDDVISK